MVINLISRNRDSWKFSVAETNLEGAKRIARICSQADNAPALIHVSHLGASQASPSKYLQVKHSAEKAVHAIYPAAIIVRPAMLFGMEDRLINAIAEYGRYSFGLACVHQGAELVRRPVYVGDAAEGLTRIARDAKHLSSGK